MIILRSTVQAEREQSSRGTIVVCTKSQLANGRVVDLQRRAIQPVFAIERAIQEDASAIAEHAFHAQGSTAILRCNRSVHRAAHIIRNGGVSVGAESFSAGNYRPLPEAHRAPTRAERRVLVSVRPLHESVCLHRMTRLQIDHSAQRIVSIQRRDTARDELHFVEGRLWQARPINPAAKGIVERDTVSQDQRAARSTRAESAQRHTLRCGIGRLAARSAQQRKADHVAQLVVGRERPPLLQLCGADGHGVGLRFHVIHAGGQDGSAGRRHVETLLHRCRRERYGELVPSRLPRCSGGCETGCAHHHTPAGGGYPSEDEAAIGLRRPADFLPVNPKQDLRFGNYSPTAVFHDAAQFLRRCSPHAELHHQECQSHDRGNLATADLRHPCIFAHRPQLLNYRISDE